MVNCHTLAVIGCKNGFQGGGSLKGYCLSFEVNGKNATLLPPAQKGYCQYFFSAGASTLTITTNRRFYPTSCPAGSSQVESVIGSTLCVYKTITSSGSFKTCLFIVVLCLKQEMSVVCCCITQTHHHLVAWHGNYKHLQYFMCLPRWKRFRLKAILVESESHFRLNRRH